MFLTGTTTKVLTLFLTPNPAMSDSEPEPSEPFFPPSDEYDEYVSSSEDEWSHAYDEEDLSETREHGDMGTTMDATAFEDPDAAVQAFMRLARRATGRTRDSSVSPEERTPSPAERGHGPDIHTLLAERERGGGPRSPLEAINRRLASLFIPERPTLAASHHDRGYVGMFSERGDVYCTAWQGSRVLALYEPVLTGTQEHMRLAKTIHCRTIQWTVCDMAITSDSRFIAYSTIAPVIHLASVGDLPSGAPTTSVANVTDLHETFDLRNAVEYGEYGEGVWAVRWSAQDDMILAGTSKGCYLYDVRSNKVARRFMRHHQDDVNAVCYGDESGNVFYSGSDDSIILAYDARAKKAVVGGFVGHMSGLTYLDMAGGRWLLSNSKDQSAKLWDVRASMVSFAEAKKDRSEVRRFGYDYRWQAPARRLPRHPKDNSVTTYRGHAVLQTLIRAKFSPGYTNHAYVYSGSACGRVHIWDRYEGGLPIRVLDGGHDDVVRDVDWSPRTSVIASVGFEGNVVTWGC